MATERLTIDMPEGKVHIDVRSDAVKEVRQTGPNSFEVKLDRPAAKETKVSIETKNN